MDVMKEKWKQNDLNNFLQWIENKMRPRIV